MDTNWAVASNNDALEHTLERQLTGVLNRYSQENGSDTPDFILAEYLLGCLAAWNAAVTHREKWYGREPRAVGGSLSVPCAPPETV